MLFAMIPYVNLLFVPYSVYAFAKRPKKEIKALEVEHKALERPIVKAQEKLIFHTVKGYISLKAVYRGIFIQGGAGSGKTASIIEPVIKQLADLQFSGLLYDFKSRELTDKVLHAYKGNSKVKTYVVDFKNPNYSNRVNPIAPQYLEKMAYAFEFSQTLFYNLLPETIKKRDFFDREAQSVLTGIMWFLRKRHPEYCTLPHIISLILHTDLETVLNKVSEDHESAGMVASIRQSIERKAHRLVASVMSTLQNALSQLNAPDIFWILSGNDFTLDLNNENDPKFLCVGNDSKLPGTYAPVISLIISTATKIMNQPNKHPSAIVLDEAPTLYIPGFENIPATARENKIATIFGVQDYSQIIDRYGQDKAQVLLANLGHQFYGRTPNPKTAEMIKSIFSKYDKSYVTKSSTKGSSGGLVAQFGRSVNDGMNESIHERDRIKVNDIVNLSTGEFCGIIAEGHPREFLKLKFELLQQKKGSNEIHSDIEPVSEQMITYNYNKIVEEARLLFKPSNDDESKNLIDIN
ncbi:type IV secretion system DNA-binding domain-containing protein [Flavobacteriaceae bacterium MHTCC 0001]